jgi:ribosomal protein L11 methyltransferase
VSWWAIRVRADGAESDRVAAWLVQRTGQAVEQREDAVVAFVDAADDPDRTVRALRDAFGPLELACEPVPDADWSERWREGLTARRIGRLTVTPSWLPDAVPGPGCVVLDPENAFGSGEHGSTRAALALLDRHVRPGDRVLDLGSGSGILAIAAVRLGAARAIGIENDSDANVVARRNADRNEVGARVSFVDGDAGELAPLVGPADLIVSNILRNVNVQLLPAIVSALRPGGLAIFAGMEASEAELFRPSLAGASLHELDDATDAGWWAVAARRP